MFRIGCPFCIAITRRVYNDTVQTYNTLIQQFPAALVANHGPFTWGADPIKSVQHGIICEAVAEMALKTLALNPAASIPQHLQERHFKRKHGPGAYYGNPKP